MNGQATEVVTPSFTFARVPPRPRTPESQGIRSFANRRAQRIARAGPSKEMRNPSPVFLISRPPKRGSCVLVARSWALTAEDRQRLSPGVATRSDDPTISIPRIIVRARSAPTTDAHRSETRQYPKPPRDRRGASCRHPASRRRSRRLCAPLQKAQDRAKSGSTRCLGLGARVWGRGPTAGKGRTSMLVRKYLSCAAPGRGAGARCWRATTSRRGRPRTNPGLVLQPPSLQCPSSSQAGR